MKYAREHSNAANVSIGLEGIEPSASWSRTKRDTGSPQPDECMR